jgi:ABC-type anion transport system duplicated permease subunit
MIDLKGNVSGPAQKKMGREVALHCLSAIYGFPLYFFITHTQTICNRLVPCVSIMFTSYPRSFLPISTVHRRAVFPEIYVIPRKNRHVFCCAAER